MVLGPCRSAILAAVIVGVLSGCAGWSPGQQSYWDARVRELCKKDGGVTVYEQVKITRREFDALGGLNGTVPVPIRAFAQPGTPYVAETKRFTIHEWAPEVLRRETSIIRVADGKVLSRQIQYLRIGGDFPSPSHESSYSCADVGVPLDVERKTFLVTENAPQ